jgi:hypothetical protein
MMHKQVLMPRNAIVSLMWDIDSMRTLHQYICHMYGITYVLIAVCVMHTALATLHYCVHLIDSNTMGSRSRGGDRLW